MSPENGQVLAGEAKSAFLELLDVASLRAGQIVVIGCSTSEVVGKKIGSAGSWEAAQVMISEFDQIAKDRQIRLAIQCCEHLNRALVVERTTAEVYGLTEVTVIPVRHAGGSMAESAMAQFEDPVVVETIQAHAGIDIGCTLIGMHLRPVAVPVRLEHNHIGQALVLAARTRPKLIGGERAIYTKA